MGMMDHNRQPAMRHFYFSNQSGVMIDDVIAVEIALLVIAELRQRGFYYCYSLRVG